MRLYVGRRTVHLNRNQVFTVLPSIPPPDIRTCIVITGGDIACME